MTIRITKTIVLQYCDVIYYNTSIFLSRFYVARVSHKCLACVSACQPRIELSDKKGVVRQCRGLILHSQISARHLPFYCIVFVLE